MLRGVVSRPLHLAAKQSKSETLCRTSLRGSAICSHQLTSEPIPCDHQELDHQVEHLPAPHLHNYLRSALLHSVDLDQAIEERKKSLRLESGQSECPLSKDSFNALDGRHLDAIFDVDQKSETSLTLRNLDHLTELFLCSAFDFREVKDKKKKSAKAARLSEDCVVYCSGGGPSRGSEESDLPSADALNATHDYLVEAIPSQLNRRVDISAYTQDIVLVNNLKLDKPEVIEGASNYFVYVSKMRTYIHIKYAKARLAVVRTWQDSQKGTVRVQWRLSTISQLQAMMFWRFSFWKMDESFAKYAKNLEAVSTFHINKDGQIYKHVVDRVIVDGDSVVKKSINPLEKLVKKAAPSML